MAFASSPLVVDAMSNLVASLSRRFKVPLLERCGLVLRHGVRKPNYSPIEGLWVPPNVAQAQVAKWAY